MLNTALQITVGIAIIIYFMIILLLLKEKKLSLKYTLLWLLAGLIMAIMDMFPRLLKMLSNLVGIQSEMNGLFTFCIVFIIMILLSITSIVTRQNRKIRILVQECAIMQKRIRELETDNANGKED